MAGSDDRGDNPPSHRSDREEAARDAIARLPEELHPVRPVDDPRRTEGEHAARNRVPIFGTRSARRSADIRTTLPQGIQGPFFNDGFGDTFGTIYAFTADGFTARELRDYVEQVRSELLAIPDAAKITLIGTQDEKIYLEFDTRQLAGLGIDSNEVVASLRAQNAVEPAGIIRGARESILLRVTGEFLSEESLRNLDLYANGRFYRLRDVATVRRGYADPPQPMFRFNGEPAIGLAVATAKGADILRFGDALRRRMEEIKADLPIGIEPHLVADQSIVARAAVSRFTEALWEAIAIVLAVSFLTLGLRAGAVVALSIPLVLAIVFLGMALGGISLQRVSLGALVIALGLLVDDAMVTIEMMVSRFERGFDRLAAATHAYSTTAFPMLTGTLVTIAGFVPIGFARSNAGEYCFSLFAVIAIALVVSWLVAVLFTPLLGVIILREPSRPRLAPRPPGLRGASVPQRAAALHARALRDNRRHARAVRARGGRIALRAAAILSGFRPAGAGRRSLIAAKRDDHGDRGRGRNAGKSPLG